ncbi:MAG: leucyl/phenylalanyl-tRNA--protein transferase [Ignavibacteria bacterium]|nr:leucyl/phenylalanyl-tRNA--protein transferase [Ignavibacteria bacterium]
MFFNETLEPENMIKLYSIGAFPMADEDGTIEWYFPHVRAIIPLNDFNIPRSVKQLIKRKKFEVRFDCDPMQVIKNCAKREKTWISEELIEAYERIYKLGYIHSVETYFLNKMVGGLYGVAIKGAFFGESMFSFHDNASKVALAHLIYHLVERNFKLLDVQILNPHLEMFGAREISLEEFNELLLKAHQTETSFL